MRVPSSYRRWRHGRGFGVHSPLGYALVCDVVQEHHECDYYAYADIAEVVEGREMGMRKELRRARLLHRLSARFPARNLHFRGSVPQSWQVAARASHTDLQGFDALTVACGAGECQQLESAARRDEQLIFFCTPDAEALDRVQEAVSHGIVLRDRDALLAVTRPDVAKVVYTIKL